MPAAARKRDRGTCGYTQTYLDIEQRIAQEYRCNLPSVSDQGLCGFHDENYWKEHQEELDAKFRELVKESNAKGTALLCIGFHLPSIRIIETLQTAYFSEAQFHQKADFFGAQFKEADFPGAQFHQAAYFFGAQFHQKAYFSEAQFHQAARFSQTKFEEAADFSGVKFVISLEEHHTDNMLEISEDTTGVHFVRTRFEKPAEVVFDHTYLGRVSFMNTDIERVCFRNVLWLEREGRYVLFDERRLLAKAKQDLYKNDADLTVTNVTAVYNKLRENYEYNLRYTEAGRFFISEMEVRRTIKQVGKPVIEPRKGKTTSNGEEDMRPEAATPDPTEDLQKETTAPKKLAKEPETVIRFQHRYNSWIQRNFSVLGMYRLLCLYGESYTQPAALMLVTILAFVDARLLLYIIQNVDINTTLGVSTSVSYPAWMKGALAIKTAAEDSLKAFFQLGGTTGLDLLERLISIPLLGTLVLSLRRKFERRFRH